MRWRSGYERAAWIARHPVRGGLLLGSLYFLGMLLLPSIREPRLLTTPLWVALTLVCGAAFGAIMVLYLRRRHPPAPPRPDSGA
jgi:hypothetical protein